MKLWCPRACFGKYLKAKLRFCLSRTGLLSTTSYISFIYYFFFFAFTDIRSLDITPFQLKPSFLFFFFFSFSFYKKLQRQTKQGETVTIEFFESLCVIFSNLLFVASGGKVKKIKKKKKTKKRKTTIREAKKI